MLDEVFRAKFDEVGSDAWATLESYALSLAGDGRHLGLVGFEAADIPREIGRSLLLAKIVGTPEFVDVGSGAGLPGLPLSVVLSGGTLVEPRRRAAAFLEGVIRSSGAPAKVVSRTAEDLGGSDLRESSAATVARALATPVVALELCSLLCIVGGTIILTASTDSSSLELTPRTRELLGLGEIRQERLGVGDIHQVVHIVEKVSPAHSRFPRRVGIARKRPLE